MTAPNETVADVLAEMRNSGWPSDAENWADRIDRALRGAVPVYQLRSADFGDAGWYDVKAEAYRLQTEKGREGRTLYTAPHAPAASVPDGPPTITKKVCKGCPHLKTKWWRDDLDNDETDSGTSATCTLADKHITAYWRDNDSPPTWCPLNVPKPTTPEPTHADDR